MSEGPSSPELVGDDWCCEALLELARPEIYCENPFRLLEVPIDASSRDISRRSRRQQIMEKYGGGGRQGTASGLSLQLSAEEDQVQAAQQRLRDPERRLIDELFWIWPEEPGKSKRDQAIMALGRGDLNEAGRLWREREEAGDSDGVATHNLAVIYHVLALDWELRALEASITAEQRKRQHAYWKQALPRWQELEKKEFFWSRLADRVRELNDPRLTTGTARRIRTSLPVALLLINAQLGLRAARAGDRNWAREHAKLIWNSGWGQEAIDEALSRALRPLRDRVKSLCQQARTNSDADPAGGDAVVQELIHGTRQPLRIMDYMLPRGNPMRQAAHDEVANAALEVQVKFGRETEDWQRSEELLKSAAAVAEGQATRERLEDNLNTVRENARYKRLVERCFFCTRAADDGAELEVQMYGNITRTPTLEGTHVEWQKAVISVPRCNRCKKAHGKAVGLPCGLGCAGAIAALIIAGIVSSVTGDSDAAAAAWLVGTFVLGVGGAVMGWAMGQAQRGVKPIEHRDKYPPIRELISKGWQFGEGPSG
ncbi:MAG: hypothetical protein U9R79_09550 [Armatimonadota bacterium]|nr:hypothetical protein [Armatimonadota bacterium]